MPHDDEQPDPLAAVQLEMETWRREHPRATFAEIERAVEARLGRVRAELMRTVAQQAEEPVQLCPDCGRRLVPKAQQPRSMTVAGGEAVELSRSYLTCPHCQAGLFPLDELLDLPAGSFSPFLHDAIVRLGTCLPFRQVPAPLEFLTGVRVSSDTVRRLTEQAGAALVVAEAAEQERLMQEAPVAPPGPAVQQVSADGAMVPLIHGEWAEVRTLALGTVGRDAKGAVHATDLAYFSRLCDAATFTSLATLATHRAGTERAGVVCAVMDGAEWLQRFIEMQCPDAVRILDFPHAAEYMAKATHAVFGAGTEAGTTWLEQQLHALKTRDAAEVLDALRALPASSGAAGVRDTALGYLEARREQLRYAEFQRLGYPIGSGAVESANKLVVEARLKGSGMHWARGHVSPMVALRAAYCSQDWEHAWGAIGRQLAQDRHRCRTARRAARAPVTTIEPEPAGVPVPAPLLPPRTPEPPKAIAGRPTEHHPWKRPFNPARAQAAARS